MTSPAEIINGALRAIDAMPPPTRRIMLDAVAANVQQLRAGHPVDSSRMIETVATQGIIVVKMIREIPGASDRQRNEALLAVLQTVRDELRELDYATPTGPQVGG